MKRRCCNVIGFKETGSFNISRSIQIFQTDKLRRVPLHVYLCLGQECHSDLLSNFMFDESNWNENY